MFGGSSQLIRYVDIDQRFNKRRAAHGAFLGEVGDSHLSVQSLEIESKRVIAEYYQRAFQEGKGKVAYCVHTIYEYNTASKDTDGAVTYNKVTKQWEFGENRAFKKATKVWKALDKAENKPAYLLREAEDCKSHCGIEYFRVLDETQMLKVARQLALKVFELASC